MARATFEFASGATPRRVNMNWSRASSATRQKSKSSGNVSPAPTAAPLIAPSTGVASSQNATDCQIVSDVTPSSRSCSAWKSAPKPPSVMSMPEQNAFPAPVTTIARISGSSSRPQMASCSSRCMVRLIALRCSGRCSVTVATPPSRSTSTVSLPAHVAPLGVRRVGRGHSTLMPAASRSHVRSLSGSSRSLIFCVRKVASVLGSASRNST